MRKIGKWLSTVLVFSLMLGGPVSMAEEIPPSQVDFPPVISTDPETEPELPVEELKLNIEKITMGIAHSKKLKVVGLASGSACTLEFVSSDPDVASVSSGGSVRAEMPGKATITVTLKSGGEVLREFTCEVKVTMKNIPYPTMRKMLYDKRTKVSGTMFEDKGSVEAHLTMFDFYYRSPIYIYSDHSAYGSPWETIILRPVVYAKKNGSTTDLSLGVWLQSIVESPSSMSRSYYKMKFAGGGEHFDVSGSTHSRRKTIGQYMKYQLMTNGTFKISENTKTHLGRLDKLKTILSSKKPRIVIKDKAANRTHKCSIDREHAEKLKSFVKLYRKLLKSY